MSSSQFWDEKFAPQSHVYGESPNAFLQAYARTFPTGGAILSLGEGEGRNAVHLAGLGYRVTALDSSERGFEKMRALAARQGVTVEARAGDVTEADLGTETWEGVLNVYCHVPSAARQVLYQRIRRALKPGGVFLTEQFSKEQLRYQSGGPRTEDMLLTLDELTTAFEGFEVVHANREIVTLDEGPLHQGPASVVRFIARKPR